MGSDSHWKDIEPTIYVLYKKKWTTTLTTMFFIENKLVHTSQYHYIV
jgi:hypothetical protein